jgi:hypothetical protein
MAYLLLGTARERGSGARLLSAPARSNSDGKGNASLSTPSGKVGNGDVSLFTMHSSGGRSPAAPPPGCTLATWQAAVARGRDHGKVLRLGLTPERAAGIEKGNVFILAHQSKVTGV